MSEQRRVGQLYFEILVVALAVILLEISLTRVFSFKVFYYFTYLIIGIAMLGLGSGGVFVAVLPRLREAAPEKLVPWLCTFAGPATLAAYWSSALLQLNASRLHESLFELAKLGLISTSIFIPFLLSGIVLSTIFAARPQQMSRLYFVDLVGAGLGCVIVVPLLVQLTPPGVAALCAGLFALAGLRLGHRDQRLLALGSITALCSLLLAFVPGLLPDPVADQEKSMAPQKMSPGLELVHSEWSPAFRVDVIQVHDRSSAWYGRHQLVHDGNVGSSIRRFDGDFASISWFDTNARSIPFAVLGRDAEVVVIGAAGGQEVLASLYFGASRVRAVELNPVTHRLMLGKFAEWSGRIMYDPRVELVNAEGRNFVSRMEQQVDLIWLVAPDSYSAMNAASAGAFVLSESYLYTVEMVLESLAKLKPGGLLCVQFGEIEFGLRPKRSARFLTTAREAFRRLDITDAFRHHLLVGTTPDFGWAMTTILIKKGEPFDDEEVRRFREDFARIDAALTAGQPDPGPVQQQQFRERPVIWHAAGRSKDAIGVNAVNQVIGLADAELEAWYAGFDYDVRPIEDVHPFFWHFVRFRDALGGEFAESRYVWDPEEATGERVLMALLAFSAIFAAAFVLLPLLAIRGVWREIPHKRSAGVYFAAIGIGFMFYEISLIQQLTLLLGYPTHSLTVTLFALLTFTGLGSLASERFGGGRERTLLVLYGVLLALMLFYQFGLAPLIAALVGLPLAARVAIAVALVAPLGLCLGFFMPIGIRTVAAMTEHEGPIVAWCWAVNGFFSVLASILSTMLAMAFGFRWVLLAGALIYGLGILALRRIPAARRPS